MGVGVGEAEISASAFMAVDSGVGAVGAGMSDTSSPKNSCHKTHTEAPMMAKMRSKRIRVTIEQILVMVNLLFPIVTLSQVC
jgi:hypothetical protein